MGGPGWPGPSADRLGCVLVLTWQEHGAGLRDPGRASLRAPTYLSMTKAATHCHSHSHGHPTLPHTLLQARGQAASKTELRRPAWLWESWDAETAHGLAGMGL